MFLYQFFFLLPFHLACVDYFCTHTVILYSLPSSCPVFPPLSFLQPVISTYLLYGTDSPQNNFQFTQLSNHKLVTKTETRVNKKKGEYSKYNFPIIVTSMFAITYVVRSKFKLYTSHGRYNFSLSQTVMSSYCTIKIWYTFLNKINNFACHNVHLSN